MIYTVNTYDIAEALRSLGGQAKAKAIQDRVLAIRCDGAVPENYKNKRTFAQTVQRKMEDHCPQSKGFDPTKSESKFLRIAHGYYQLAAASAADEYLAIEEVSGPGEYVEGATKSIAVNVYERNTAARKKCIEHYGLNCVVCGFDFEHTYGIIGKAFTHIHHLVPLSQVQGAYVVDPIADLRPICANCHAMVHRRSPALSIDQVKEALASASNKIT